VNRLQEVSSETEETSEAGTGHGEGLVGTGSWDHGWAGHWDNSGTNGSTWCGGWCYWSWGGGVGVDWSNSWGSTIIVSVNALHKLYLETVWGTRCCSTLS
jgi:hypothetical protein